MGHCGPAQDSEKIEVVSVAVTLLVELLYLLSVSACRSHVAPGVELWEQPSHLCDLIDSNLMGKPTKCCFGMQPRDSWGF